MTRHLETNSTKIVGIAETWPYTNFHDLDLRWMIEIMKDFMDKYPQLISDMENMQQQLNDIIAGKYADVYTAIVQKWVDDNLPQLVAQLVNYVEFGVSEDGNFVAAIPDNWNFLQFDYVRDYGVPLYGHMVLKW